MVKLVFSCTYDETTDTLRKCPKVVVRPESHAKCMHVSDGWRERERETEGKGRYVIMNEAEFPQRSIGIESNSLSCVLCVCNRDDARLPRLLWTWSRTAHRKSEIRKELHKNVFLYTDTRAFIQVKSRGDAKLSRLGYRSLAILDISPRSDNRTFDTVESLFTYLVAKGLVVFPFSKNNPDSRSKRSFSWQNIRKKTVAKCSQKEKKIYNGFPRWKCPIHRARSRIHLLPVAPFQQDYPPDATSNFVFFGHPQRPPWICIYIPFLLTLFPWFILLCCRSKGGDTPFSAVGQGKCWQVEANQKKKKGIDV